MQFMIRVNRSFRSHFGAQEFENILMRSLDRFGHRVRQVILYFHDLNGPRGGIDKSCRCVIHLKRMPPVVIQDQDQKLLNLVYRIADRASHVLAQKLDRRIKRSRRPHIRNRESGALDSWEKEAISSAIVEEEQLSDEEAIRDLARL